MSQSQSSLFFTTRSNTHLRRQNPANWPEAQREKYAGEVDHRDPRTLRRVVVRRARREARYYRGQNGIGDDKAARAEQERFLPSDVVEEARNESVCTSEQVVK